MPTLQWSVGRGAICPPRPLWGSPGGLPLEGRHASWPRSRVQLEPGPLSAFGACDVLSQYVSAQRRAGAGVRAPHPGPRFDLASRWASQVACRRSRGASAAGGICAVSPAAFMHNPGWLGRPGKAPTIDADVAQGVRDECPVDIVPGRDSRGCAAGDSASAARGAGNRPRAAAPARCSRPRSVNWRCTTPCATSPPRCTRTLAPEFARELARGRAASTCAASGPRYAMHARPDRRVPGAHARRPRPSC